MNSQFIRFLMTGGIAAFVNIFSRYLLNLFIPFTIAIPIAYVIGMTTAYNLARLYVFDSSGRNRLDEFKRFTIVNIVALMIVWVISIGLVEYFFPLIRFSWHAEDVAHFIGVISPALVSYFAHRAYTFEKISNGNQ